MFVQIINISTRKNVGKYAYEYEKTKKKEKQKKLFNVKRSS